jgi:hypothetical protein
VAAAQGTSSVKGITLAKRISLGQVSCAKRYARDACAPLAENSFLTGSVTASPHSLHSYVPKFGKAGELVDVRA